MERSLIRKEVLPFLLMFGSLMLATVITDALLHQFELVWIGRWLGIPGTMLILLSFFYSMRKRKMISFGKPKTLLTLHETLTWLGALMILVHAGIHIYTILPWLALVAMLVNVISGMTGKYPAGSLAPLPGGKERQSMRNRDCSEDEIEKQTLLGCNHLRSDEAVARGAPADHTRLRRARHHPYPQYPALLAMEMKTKTSSFSSLLPIWPSWSCWRSSSPI